jgi:hypothetical protein
VESVDVVDADNESRVVETFSGADLQHRLRTLGSRRTASLALESNAARLVLIELAFERRADVPSALVHRLHVLTAPVDGGSAPAQPAYTAAPVTLDGSATVVGPPLVGGGWVDGNGCCSTDGVHRATVLPINGACTPRSASPSTGSVMTARAGWSMATHPMCAATPHMVPTSLLLPVAPS